MGFTPAGFSGNCLYPSSVFASDLLVSFSASLVDFSILYAPQELACDSSATMRVTAYLDTALVGTSTTNAVAGTWPSETLRFSSGQPFNRVVGHYDKPPVTGGDWGPIFMVDNLRVGLAPPAIILANAQMLPGGFQFGFSYTAGASASVLCTTNVAGHVGTWTALGLATEISPGQFQFTDAQAVDGCPRFYRVRAAFGGSSSTRP